MVLKRAVMLIFVGVLGLSIFGCNKSESPSQPGSSTNQLSTAKAAAAAGSNDVSRLHWIGKKRIAADTNSATFMTIWNLPETAAIGTQTLDKLSLAPWRMLKGDAATNGAPTAQLRELLGDVVQEECYLEIRHAKNQAAEFAFAIRLNEERAKLWESNLATVFESLTGAKVSRGTPAGWSLKAGPNLIELVRAGDWVVLGWSVESGKLANDLAGRIKNGRTPSMAQTNNWIEAAFDPAGLARALSLNLNLPTNMPQISLSVTGEKENVRIQGEMNFAEPLALDLKPWNIPTNAIFEPLASITALRGLQTWLPMFEKLRWLQVGSEPDQLFTWSKQGGPLQTFFATPSSDATNYTRELVGRVLSHTDDWFATNTFGRLQRMPDGVGLIWVGGPFLALRVSPAVLPEGQFMFGGLIPPGRGGKPLPQDLLNAIQGPTNLVYYEWEMTPPRAEAWVYLSQAFRMVGNREQMPITSASMIWLQKHAWTQRNSVTTMHKLGPKKLGFVRSSTIGLTSVELHVLAEWLESPRFPVGSHSLLMPKATKPLPSVITNVLSVPR